MPRPKGSKNRIRQLPAEQFSYTSAQRIELVADLIVEKILEDRHNGQHLIAILEASDATPASH
ncbi:MAG: hypothetical protein WBP22_02480 [Candidatus Saccharimonas sp.]